MFRRFGKLYARNLLQLQAEITQLEADLDKLDRSDEQDSNTRFVLCSDAEGMYAEHYLERQELFLKIRCKLTEYSKPLEALVVSREADPQLGTLLSQDAELRKLPRPSKRLHRSLFNYLWAYKPLEKTDEQFIYHENDFVLTCDQDHDQWLDNILSDHLSRHPMSLLRPVSLHQNYLK